MSLPWTLHCSACETAADPATVVNLCPACQQPMFARVALPADRAAAIDPEGRGLWRYRAVLPATRDEPVVALGEGGTPLLPAPRAAALAGVDQLWVKDEAQNPTASFKARGMAMAVTRARALGVPGLTVPTAGNAGAALAAYAAAAGMPVRVFAPRTTPPPILDMIDAFGATLVLVEGHIGDAGREARAFAAAEGWFDISTLREPYRVEGMKTMGYELAEAFGWSLPDVIVYPTGGGEGTIGIWKAIHEMRSAGWLPATTTMPRFVVTQASGCAPIVRAFSAGADRATPWENPVTAASGLRVPGPLGDRLLLRALRESDGAAVSVDESTMAQATRALAVATGVDAAPEGGCALAGLAALVRDGVIAPTARVVLFNTGSGASYRWRS